MSLGGIAIAIGAMVDAAIVMIENAHKHLERAPPGKPRLEILIEAASEVGPALFFSLLDHHGLVPADLHAGGAGRAAVQSARLHQDLRHGGSGAAFGHPGAGADGAVRSRADLPEHRNPLNRILIWRYRPVIRLVLRRRPYDPFRARWCWA